VQVGGDLRQDGEGGRDGGRHLEATDGAHGREP
jgi:hypothetical protein